MTVENKELEQLLDEHPSQTLSELGKILQVDESTVSKRLKGLGMIQKQGHWVPYELKPRTTASTAEKKRFFASHRNNPKRRKSWGKPGHASTSSAKPNIHGSKLADRRFHSYEEAQKWIDSWIASKDMSFFRRGIHVLPERWEKVVSSDGQYFK
ncbi:MOS1T transposase, partial [Pseudoatta argentina]